MDHLRGLFSRLTSEVFPQQPPQAAPKAGPSEGLSKQILEAGQAQQTAAGQAQPLGAYEQGEAKMPSRAQLRNMGIHQLIQLANAQQKGLTDQQIVNLKPEQVRELLECVDKGKLFLPDSQLSILRDMNLGNEDEGSFLQIRRFDNLSPIETAALVAHPNLPHLTNEQLAGINFNHVKEHLGEEGLRDVVNTLRADQLLFLSTSVLENLTPQRASSFNPAEMALFGPNAKAVLERKKQMAEAPPQAQEVSTFEIPKQRFQDIELTTLKTLEKHEAQVTGQKAKIRFADGNLSKWERFQRILPWKSHIVYRPPPLEAVRHMNLEALQQLASRQEKGLTDEQIVALSPTQISMLQDGIKAGKIHISDDKMALMSLMQEVHSSSPFESKNPANLAAILSETNIPKLSSEQLGKISISLARNFVSSEQWKRVLDGLSREQLQGLTPFAAAKFSPEDLSRLTPEKRQVLQGKIDEFKRQFSEITYAQAQLLESGHLEHLDAAHIKALINRDRLSWIPMKALEGMPHTSAPKFREYLEQLIPSQREIMKIKLKIYDASH